MDGAPRRWLFSTAFVLAVVALLSAACSAASVHHRSALPAAVPPTTVAPVATTTTVASAPHPPGLGSGDSGPAVLALEQRLGALHYDVGTPDGRFGPADTNAVIAFQKVHGLARTGRATDDVIAALASASDPSPLVPGGGAMRVEVDIPRQVLFLYQHDQLLRILPVSTGSGAHYCEKGDCGVAVTPGGSYRVGTKILGLHVSPLGQLWNPLFFNGGIAIHGEPWVPTYPASHGCVRIPMNSSLWFFNEVPSGTPVYVVGGPHAPVPLGVPMPSATTAPPATTSTTARSAPTTPPATTVPTTTPPTTAAHPTPTTAKPASAATVA